MGKYRIPGVSSDAGKLYLLAVSAPEGIRTPNLLIRSQMLYPLSYGRLFFSCRSVFRSRTQRRREDLNLRSPLRGTTH